jgi:acetyltransferase
MDDHALLMSKADLCYLFNPRNVCIIGASDNRNKVGAQVLTNIISARFAGEIFPINPKAQNLFGLKVYKSIRELSNFDLDLAIITIPNIKVPAALEECIDQNVKFAVLITAGFSEMKEYNSEGVKLTDEVAHLLKKGSIHIVGPNCMGIVSTECNLLGLMGPGIPPGRQKVNASIISQSGTWGVTCMRSGHSHALGFSKFVSSGNEMDLKFEDYLEYLGLYDSDTQIILGFIEGLREGRRFIQLAQEIDKPIVLIKGGKTESGRKTASSHTGSLAGSQKIYEAIFNQCGIIEANDLNELVDFGRAFQLYLSFQPPKLPKGNRVGIASGGGGFCVLMADQAELEGLEVAQLDPATIEKMNEILPPYWPHRNPVDLVATWDFGSYSKILKILLDDPNIDAVIARPPLGFSLFYESEEVQEFIRQNPVNTFNAPLDLIKGFDLSIVKEASRVAQRSQKPVIVPLGFYSPENPIEYEMVRELYKRGIMVTPTSQMAARVLKKLSDYYQSRQKKNKNPKETIEAGG